MSIYLIRFIVTGLIITLFNGTCIPPSSSDDGKTTRDSEDGETAEVRAWQKLDNALLGPSKATFHFPPNKSLNGQWLYLATGENGGFAVLDIGNDFAANVLKKEKWTSLSLENPNFDGSPGKAKINDKGRIRYLNSTKEGLAFTWNASFALNAESAAVYIKGKELDLAWGSLHVNWGAFAVNDEVKHFFVIEKGNDEIPYLMFYTKALFGIHYYDFVTHTHLKPEQLNYAAGIFLKSAWKLDGALFAQNNDTAFLVGQGGISTLPVNDAGTAKPFTEVKSTDLIYGSELWNMPGWNNGGTRIENYLVSSVTIADELLYIGLQAYHDLQGGIAIFDPKQKKLIAPAKDIWNKVSVEQVLSDGRGQVWALTATELIAVNKDGTILTRLNAQMVKNSQAQGETKYSGEMPSKNLRGAAFFGDDLLLANDQEVYVMLKTKIKKTQ